MRPSPVVETPWPRRLDRRTEGSGRSTYGTNRLAETGSGCLRSALRCRRSGKEVTLMETERRVRELGIQLPDFGPETYYGASYGKMKPFHRTGNLLFLSGHIPERNGQLVHPGRLGDTVTLEQGYEAARVTG